MLLDLNGKLAAGIYQFVLVGNGRKKILRLVIDQ